MNYKTLKNIENQFIRSNGYMRTKDFINAGLSYYYLPKLKEEGIIDEIKRGLYRWGEMDFGGLYQYIDISKIIPNCVFCLYSALELLELSSYISNIYYVAIDRKRSYIPKQPEYPQIKVKTFSGNNFSLGIISIKIDNQEIKLYDMEKTICDFVRLKFDIHVLKEALLDYLTHPKMDIDKLTRYAKILRVENPIQRYLEVLI